MYRFWSTLIKPVLDIVQPNTIVEIGCGKGYTTDRLLEYVQQQGAVLHAIDPQPAFDVDVRKQQYGRHFVFHRAMSLNALPLVGPAQVVLIDGDHNWYTVLNELRLIAKTSEQYSSPFPVVLLHDVGWPHGRRDMYYNPEAIPDAFRKPFKQKGVAPGTAELMEEGGLNAHLNHSIYENSLQNGVLTAIEDFLKEATEVYRFAHIPGLAGLGLLASERVIGSLPQFAKLLQSVTLSPLMTRHVEVVEWYRNQAELRAQDYLRAVGALEAEKKSLGELLAHTQQKLQEITARAQSLEQELERTRADSRTRSALEAKEVDIAELRRRVGHIQQLLTSKESELAHLTNWIEQLIVAVRAIAQSRRWKLGSALSELVRRLRFRPPVETAVDHAERIIRRFEDWQTKRTALDQARPHIPSKSASTADATQSARALGEDQVRVSSPDIKKLSAAEDMAIRMEHYQEFLRQEAAPGPTAGTKPSARVVVLATTPCNTADLHSSVSSVHEACSTTPITVVVDADTTLEYPADIAVDVFNNSAPELGTRLNGVLEACGEEYIFFLRAGDRLARNALGWLAHKLASFKHGATKVGGIVVDEDHLADDSSRTLPCFKPGFSPDFLLESDYVGLGVWINRQAALSVGGFQPTYREELFRDLLLRMWEEGYSFEKIDHVCCHRLRPAWAPGGTDEHKRLLEAALQRRGINAAVERVHGSYRPVYPTRGVMASIIIPFRDKPAVLKTCVESILTQTEYDSYEILLVDNNSTEQETADLLIALQQDPRVRVLLYPGQFNYSKINNFAAREARGQVLVFLNNDTKVLSNRWLNELVGDALVPGIGAVGAKLYYENGTIQHAGVVIGLTGLAGHLFAGEDEVFVPQEWVHRRRNCSAVTAACMAVSKEVFEAVGGFCELFEVTGNDVELCLRLLKRGYRNIFNPEVRLFHFEKTSRKEIGVRPRDVELSIRYYGPFLEMGDPFYNGNLTLNGTTMALRLNETPAYKAVLTRYAQQEQPNALPSRVQSISKPEAPPAHIKLDQEVVLYDVQPQILRANHDLMDAFMRKSSIEVTRVLWFIPYFEHIYWGGLYTIFRAANHLSERAGAHQIFVFYGRPKKTLAEIQQMIVKAFPRMRFEVLHLSDGQDPNELPSSDIAFCTLWNSAYHLVRYQKCQGKFYFVQDFEPLFFPAGSVAGLVEQTYRFGFVGIANTPGVAEGYRCYNPRVHHFIPGVDSSIFYPAAPRLSNGPVRIVMYARPDKPRNGFRLGVEALRKVKEILGDAVEIVTVGANFSPEEYGLQDVLTNLGVLPTISSVAELYRSCDIGLVFMFTRHPSYQPIEYMASGCAVVTNRNEANEWLLRDGYNALLAEPTVSCVADRIVELASRPDLRATLIKNGLVTVSEMTWERAMDQIYAAVTNPWGRH